MKKYGNFNNYNKVLKQALEYRNIKSRIECIQKLINNANDVINNSYLSQEEYDALVNTVARAKNNGKTLLGYTSDNNYEAYVPTDGMGGSGGAKGVWQSVQSVASNIFDPRTRL